MEHTSQDKSAHGSDFFPIQCKMARTALDIGVRELAVLSQVSTDTIVRFERGDDLKPRTVAALRNALEAAGVEFIAENGGGAGVRLRKGIGQKS